MVEKKLVIKRDERLDALMKSARKAFGADSLTRLGLNEVVNWPALTTGLVSVDNILGIGFIPYLAYSGFSISRLIGSVNTPIPPRLRS